MGWIVGVWHGDVGAVSVYGQARWQKERNEKTSKKLERSTKQKTVVTEQPSSVTEKDDDEDGGFEVVEQQIDEWEDRRLPDGRPGE